MVWRKPASIWASLNFPGTKFPYGFPLDVMHLQDNFENLRIWNQRPNDYLARQDHDNIHEFMLNQIITRACDTQSKPKRTIPTQPRG